MRFVRNLSEKFVFDLTLRQTIFKSRKSRSNGWWQVLNSFWFLFNKQVWRNRSHRLLVEWEKTGYEGELRRACYHGKGNSEHLNQLLLYPTFSLSKQMNNDWVRISSKRALSMGKFLKQCVSFKRNSNDRHISSLLKLELRQATFTVTEPAEGFDIQTHKQRTIENSTQVTCSPCQTRGIAFNNGINLLIQQMVRMGRSLEKYRDVKLQQFRSQLSAEDSHVS